MDITKEEADIILGWVALLKIAEPRIGYSPDERDLLKRMEKYADA